MKHGRIADSASSKPKAYSLLVILTWGVVFTIGIILVSCCKENDNTNSDEYYVKYEVTSHSDFVRRTLNTTITSEDNEELIFAFETDTPWETIIGPVQKGFNATLVVSCDYDSFINARIYVSKNDSPFALKKGDESETLRDYVQISYTIDY